MFRGRTKLRTSTVVLKQYQSLSWLSDLLTKIQQTSSQQEVNLHSGWQDLHSAEVKVTFSYEIQTKRGFNLLPALGFYF